MNYTVIVAEDEELLLNNLVHKIEKADPEFQVIGTAQTGAQALTLVEQLSPDVVFTDIKMPVMDGITLLTKIRDQFPFTKFVITSGFSDFEYAKKAITLKVSDYLLKPVDPDELQNVLLKIKQELQIKRDDYETVFAPGASSMSPNQIAELLKNFMVQNYAEDINLNLIAGTMNYSPSYLTKMFVQQRLVELGWPTALLFVPMLLSGLASMLGVEAARRLHPKSLRRFYAVCALLCGGGCALVGAAPVLGCIFGCMLVQGVIDAYLLHEDQKLNDIIPSDQRATLISVDSMAYSLLMIPASPLVGLVGDLAGQAGAGLCVLGALVGVSGLAAAGKTRYNGRGA